MKKVLVIALSTIMLIGTSIPIYAYEYSFESGADTKSTFGSSTSNDDPVPVNPETTNIRRNKDAAYFPPSYGVFSGDIPTDPTSPYHNNDLNQSMGTSSSWSGGISGSSNGAVGISNYAGDSNLPDQMLPSTSISYSDSQTINTEPWKYDNGTIGTLYIEKLKKTIKVYEGESLENMKNGIGHFESTSAWDGNCAFAGHNRGASAYFSFVKDLNIGDRITYTTKYGIRTYEIYNKSKISETDYSALGYSAENIITMITCVEGVSELRWCVQAREV